MWENRNVVPCSIWETAAESINGDDDRLWRRDFSIFNSPRAGGIYAISGDAQVNIGRDRQYPDFCARLTTWLIDQRRMGIECPEITTEILDRVSVQKPLTVSERADRILRYLKTQLPKIGDIFQLPTTGEDHALLAWSESLQMSEVTYLFDYLMKMTFVEKDPFSDKSFTRYTIAPRGYARLDELDLRLIDSAQAFVAMWFDETMNKVYDAAIAPGIEDAGYKPLRIDSKDHNNKIDDEIVAEIRRSRFAIADFTHGRGGMRGGVYYEAGFAHGLGRPVIFTCRNDLLKKNKIHFDTRQYNHIGWNMENLDAFRKDIANRISATIGDGPLKKGVPGY